MAQPKDKLADSTDILPIEEYHAIESAVLETARGRWFLEEYARRNRVADTDILLKAIARIEDAIGGGHQQTHLTDAPMQHPEPAEKKIADDETLQQLHLEISELLTAMQLTRQEIDKLGSQQAHDVGFEPTINEMDDILGHTEQAISQILKAAEAMQASAWAAREEGTDTDICDRLDKGAIDIYTACTLQELTSQRIAKLISVVKFADSHIHTMLQHFQFEDATAEPSGAISPDPKQTAQLNDDTRPADVFAVETSPPNDEADMETKAAKQSIEETETTDVAGDPFEGQDAFDTTSETLKGVSSLS